MNRITRRRALASSAAMLTAGLTGGMPSRGRAAEPIKLGAALSLTGRFSDAAKYCQEAYLLWSEQVNARGGIAGRPVSITIYDDESNPDTGRVLAERLIDRDGAIALLGPYSSPITDAMATAAERAQVPLIGMIASDSSIWSRRRLRWTFQAFPSSDYDHEGFLDIVKARAGAAKKLAIVFEETPFSIAAKDWGVQRAKEIGLTVDTYGYTPGAQDFRSIVERMVAAGTEMVSMGGYYQPAIALTRQMAERGFNPVGYHFILSADGVTKDALGANAEGIFGRSAWEASIDTPANNAFIAAYKARFSRTPSYHSAASYAAGQIVEAAIKAKGASATAVRDFLATGSIESVLGTFRVNAKGQQEGYRYVATQWQGGACRVVGGSTQQPVIWPKPKWS